MSDQNEEFPKEQDSEQEGQDQQRAARVNLVEESEAGEASDSFERELEQTLQDTEKAVLDLQEVSSNPDQAKSWHHAREIVEDFKPVPWFIWRLSNFVFSRPGRVAEISEGLVFGMRRLMFAVASDPVLGTGSKVNNVRQALEIVPSDVIAAVSVIHAGCRRLAKRPHERIWRPILDDALLRARIGYEVGKHDLSFGPGRGMLAGYAGRCGLAILIASSGIEDARKALEMLATGVEIRDVGMAIYKCDPLQVSAMTLSAAGCGRDAAFGTVAYASNNAISVVNNDEQMRWLAAFSITESVRIGKIGKVDAKYWDALGLADKEDRDELAAAGKKVIRRGHGWQWIV